MKAWVITYAWLDAAFHKDPSYVPEVVIGVLSARKSSSVVSEYIKGLYMLFRHSAQEHIESAHYTKPVEFLSVRQQRKNITCGDNPFIIASLASNIRYENGLLEWEVPKHDVIRIINEQSVMETVDRKCKKAPVKLPIKITGFPLSRE